MDDDLEREGRLKITCFGVALLRATSAQSLPPGAEIYRAQQHEDILTDTSWVGANSDLDIQRWICAVIGVSPMTWRAQPYSQARCV